MAKNKKRKASTSRHGVVKMVANRFFSEGCDNYELDYPFVNDGDKIYSSVAYLPSCNNGNHVNYSVGKGLYIEFRFTSKDYVVYLDGNPMLENVEDVNMMMSKAPIDILGLLDEGNENERKLTFVEKVLYDNLKEGRELFTRFEELVGSNDI